MEELVIQKHNFETAKSKIQKYADTAPKGVSIPSVKTDGGLFGLGDHKVTGAELNARMGTVQTALISLNSASKAIISEFKEVYNAFEALDKDYISGIVISVNAAKKASDEAKKASDNISRTIEALKKTVGKLSDFENEVRNEITSLKAKSGQNEDATHQHIDDIDSIWTDVQSHQSTLDTINNQLVKLEQALSAIDKFKNSLIGLQHLEDIDSIWKDLQSHYQSYEAFYNACVSFKAAQEIEIANKSEQIANLNAFRADLEKQEHLKDIDSAYHDLMAHYKDYSEFHNDYVENKAITKAEEEGIKTRIGGLEDFKTSIEIFKHLTDIDALWEQVQTQHSEIAEHKNTFDNFTRVTQDSIKGLNEQVAILLEYKSALEGYVHLRDIDSLWSDSQKSQEEIINIKKNFNDTRKEVDEALSVINSNLAILNEYTDKLKSFSHLDEVDKIWDDLQNEKAKLDQFKQEYDAYVSNMASSFQSLSESAAELAKITSDHSERVQKLESDAKTTNERITVENARLSHRIRVNHIISASSVILLITLFVLNILKVI